MMLKSIFILLITGFMAAMAAVEETPATALLVLNQGDSSLAIVDPISLKVVGRVSAGADPHEVVASADGKLAFNGLTVIDLETLEVAGHIETGPGLDGLGWAVRK
jgi:DNA-binding beta-propeller fold protein YncE